MNRNLTLLTNRSFLSGQAGRSFLSVVAVLLVLAGTACSQRSRAVSVGEETITVAIPPAPTTPAALNVPLQITQRPATFGVPLPETANVREAAQLTLQDISGKPVSAQFRVLARWRGTATDATRPIKWLLVDADAATGNYRLATGGANPKPATNVTVSDGAALEVKAAHVSLRVPKQGASLLTSFALDGAEQLLQPARITLELPRAALLVNKAFAAKRELTVSDSSAVSAGARVRFESTSEMTYDTEAGATRFAVVAHEPMEAGRRYRIEENTGRAEDVMVEREDESGWFYPRLPLRFPHPAGCTVRDLTAETETAVISAVKGQIVTLTAPLKELHVSGERMVLADENSAPLRLQAWVNETQIEENGPLRTVIRQDGGFRPAGATSGELMTPLRFTVRYHVFAGQPFVRVQLRMVNTGVFGFGGSRNEQPPYAQHILLNGLSFHLPMAGASVQREEARGGPLNASNRRVATLRPGKANIEITVPEFAENFPKALVADAEGLHFDILPLIVVPEKNTTASAVRTEAAARAARPGELPPLPLSDNYYIFDGARAKSAEFYLGAETRNAAALTNSFGAALDPAYVAGSKAVRPVLTEKRDWRQVIRDDRQLAAAAMRLERWLASSYAREASEENDAISIYEMRQGGHHYGWRNFGDLEWGDGFANLHYDLPWILLREYLRTGDKRAYQLGSEMARYRADWGQHQADDYWDRGRTYNLRGMAFYEKGDHGTYREPIFTHHWIEGLWLYWALTGDEAVHQSAREGAEAVQRFNFTFENSLSWGESRFVGWPVLAMTAAWRYSGEARYLEKAKRLTYLLVQAEEDFGRKGYYIPPGSNIGNCTQPFMWAGYSQIGVAEYWRETQDQRAADYMVRVADWLLGKTRQRPVLAGGVSKPDGIYVPLSVPYFWCPNKENESLSIAQSMLAVPLLSVTAQITGRTDLHDKAQQLFRDATWFRDAPEQGVPGGNLSPIAFRSRMYAASYAKVYGQFALSVPEFLNTQAAKVNKQQ